MLRLPVLESKSPTSLEELVVAMQLPGAFVVAGGTDLLPNLKHRLYDARVLVSIHAVEELKQIVWDDDAGVVRIGAGVTLSELSADPDVGEKFPSLAHAAGVVASPLIRNMGTIGGNINLDTRCRYVNQTEFWRSAIGGCLKSEGDVCHVVPKGRSCVAAMSADCVPVLISLDAHLVLLGPDGRREVAMADYYSTDGISHTLRKPGEVTAEVVVPYRDGSWKAAYTKWSVRKSIDFPLISVAFAVQLDDRDLIRDSRLVLGVLAAKPKVLRADSIVGRSLADAAEEVGELCWKQGKTLPNIPYEPEHRRKMLQVFARRLVERMATGGLPATLPS